MLCQLPQISVAYRNRMAILNADPGFPERAEGVSRRVTASKGAMTAGTSSSSQFEDDRPLVSPPRLMAFLLAMIALYALYSTPGLWLRWGGFDPWALPWLAMWLAAASLALPLASGRFDGRIRFLAAIAAISLRAAAMLPFFGRTPGGDAFFYPALAHSLLTGHGLQVFEPFMGDRVRALYPPAYPLLLSGWAGLFGVRPVSLGMMNLLIDSLAASLIAGLGRRLRHGAAGRAAAWLYFIWPPVLLSAPVAQKEGLTACLTLMLIHAWLNGVERAGWKDPMLVGLVTGLLALTQPALAPLSAILGLTLLGRQPRRLIRVAFVGGATAVLAMTPWWTRNWLVFGHFVPLTSSGGTSLWIGNNPAATGDWIPEPQGLRGVPELAYSKAAASMAWQWIERNPFDFMRLTAQKLLRSMASAQAEIARLRDARPAPDAAIGRRLFPVAQLSHLMMLCGAALMLWRIHLRNERRFVAIVAACILQVMLFNVWFEFAERHREFLTPLLLLLIGLLSEAACSQRDGWRYRGSRGKPATADSPPGALPVASNAPPR